jgi:hypothetical protein
VSVELSAPENYEGGLYIGKRFGYSSDDGWKTAPTLPPLAQGSAVVHRGNLTHGVTLKNGADNASFGRFCLTKNDHFTKTGSGQTHETLRTEVLSAGERWSLVVFFFRSCETQTTFFERAERVREQQRQNKRLRHKSDEQQQEEAGVWPAAAAAVGRVGTVLRDGVESFLIYLGCA